MGKNDSRIIAIYLSLEGIKGADIEWKGKKHIRLRIRIAGCLTINIGIFNILAAYSGFKQFYNWMFIARGLFIVCIFGLVSSKQAPAIFLLFAATDLLGIAWTYLAAE